MLLYTNLRTFTKEGFMRLQAVVQCPKVKSTLLSKYELLSALGGRRPCRAQILFFVAVWHQAVKHPLRLCSTPNRSMSLSSSAQLWGPFWAPRWSPHTGGHTRRHSTHLDRGWARQIAQSLMKCWKYQQKVAISSFSARFQHKVSAETSCRVKFANPKILQADFNSKLMFTKPKIQFVEH